MPSIFLPWTLVVVASALASPPDTVRRLPLSAFPQLPAAIRREATRRGCAVPQSNETRDPHNVVRGEFTGSGVDGWALLCSREKASAILVCVDGARVACETVAESPDASWMQKLEGESLAYSRLLLKVSAGRSQDGVTLRQDAIEDAFAGKASDVWYRDRGRWRRLMGAD
jgi:hypothetical protein